jgi:tRNA (cmo5U34)-methyltransferase
MTSTRVHHHDWHSAAYVQEWIDLDVTDDERRRPTLRRIAALIPGGVDDSLQILDVGGGYGTFAHEVLSARPHATIVLQDYSTAMIAQAHERLGGFGDRVSCHRSDMADSAWTDELAPPFDAVISALAIHNLGDPDVIARVYRDVYSLLGPGGWFFNYELVFPTGPGVAELFRRDPTRSATWGVEISPAGLDAHLHWLREAGFAEVDCLWRDLDQAVLCGLRTH